MGFLRYIYVYTINFFSDKPDNPFKLPWNQQLFRHQSFLALRLWMLGEQSQQRLHQSYQKPGWDGGERSRGKRNHDRNDPWIYCWLVVFHLPLWKTWVCQLGWWHSQYMEKKKCSKQQVIHRFIEILTLCKTGGLNPHFEALSFSMSSHGQTLQVNRFLLEQGSFRSVWMATPNSGSLIPAEGLRVEWFFREELLVIDWILQGFMTKKTGLTPWFPSKN